MKTESRKRHNRFANLQTIEQLRVEKVRLNEELDVHEVQLKSDYLEIMDSVNFLSSITGLIRHVTNQLTILNGLSMGFKLFSSIFHKPNRKKAE
ncbi:MAG: hypothetical protein ACRCR3_02395 [Tannerellaceae bacterium]